MASESTSISALAIKLLGLLCLSSIGCPHNVRGVNGPRTEANSREPFFVTPIDLDTGHPERNVTVVEGGRAMLTCTVRHLSKNSTVSWIRKSRHPVVLTSGQSVFTSDRRMKLLQPEGDPDAWQLIIDPAMERDNGFYECQVNTRDTMSLVYKLNVEPAKARIFGESAVYVKAGSTISLTCAINLYSVPPPDIIWLHGTKVLHFDSPRGGISLEIEKTRTGTTSKLLVTRAMPSDSGTYTCDPTRGQSATADVHIITDEYPAELQDGQTSLASRQTDSSPSGLIFLLLFVLCHHFSNQGLIF